MNTLQQRRWQDLADQVADICRRFRLVWGRPAVCMAEEVTLTFLRNPDRTDCVAMRGQLVCSVRLGAVLVGFRWTLCHVETGQTAATGKAGPTGVFDLA